jgi:hypothetical protein
MKARPQNLEIYSIGFAGILLLPKFVFTSSCEIFSLDDMGLDLLIVVFRCVIYAGSVWSVRLLIWRLVAYRPGAVFRIIILFQML